MKHFLCTTLFLISTALGFSSSSFALKVGESAPVIQVKDLSGKLTSVADFKGKYVVLEWHNQGCPYVKKHYKSGNMQKLQAKAKELGVLWVTVISSKEGKQGYVTLDEEKSYLAEQKATPTDVLFDTESKFATEFGAKTTPHMMVIDPKGVLIYSGAIDDKDSSDPEDVAKAKNYVLAALTESLAGRPVSVSSTRPYGCGVKY